MVSLWLSTTFPVRHRRLGYYDRCLHFLFFPPTICQSLFIFDMFLDVWNTATNLSNSYSNDMLTVKLSGFPDMHWRDLFTSTRRQVAHYYLVFKHFLQEGSCNSTQFKNSLCQSKPFRWLMCRNDDRIFLLRVLSIKRVRSCNWLTEAQSTSNCGVCQVSFYVPKWL